MGMEIEEGSRKSTGEVLEMVVGLERSVPGYMIREELQRDKLEGKAGLRAWSYEKRLEEGGGGGELARRCWEEIKRRAKEGKVGSGWEEGRGKERVL